MLRASQVAMLGELAADGIAEWAKRKKRNAILYSIVLVLLSSAYILGIASAVVFIGQTQGMLAALVLLTSVFVVSAVFLTAVIMIVNRRDQRRARQRDSRSALYATTTVAALPAVARMTGLPAIAVAGVGGLALVLLLRNGSRDS